MGGMIARRKEVWSPKEDGLSGILAAVYAAAAEIDPRIMPPEPAPADQGSCCENGDFGDGHECLKQDGAVVDALRAEAEAAGVRVDRRWGEARLRQEIAAAGHERAPTGD